jgi:ribonuclease HI
VDTATLLGLLRRLAHAKPGPAALHLPVGLSSREAIQAIRAAIRALEPRALPVDAPRAAVAGAAAATRVHIDGASRGNPGPAGIGVLFLQPDGTVVERLHRGIGKATNNVAEYSALLMALERARAMGITDLDVYSDSELLVRQIQGRYQVKHPALRPLYVAARGHIAGLRHFTIHHVPRELNAEADSLANQGIDEAARVGSDLRPALDPGENG